VNRERVGAAVLAAYPADTRAAQGAEMLGTLLEVSADSTVRFAAEAGDLLRLGLRARAVQIGAVGARRLLADGACLAGTFLLAEDLATALHSRGVLHAVYSPASMAVLAVVLIVALGGHDRIAGTGALVWIGLRFSGVMAGTGVAAYSATVLPVICLGVMVLIPRGRISREPLIVRYAVDVLVALVVLAGGLGGVSAIFAVAAATVFGVIAAVLLTTDPRPAIAVALVAANVGIEKVGSGRPALTMLMLTTAAPVVLALTVARTRRLVKASQ
jgi:hypothetical protein